MVKDLQKVIPISRAQMRLKFVIPAKDAKRIKERMTKQFALEIEKEDWEDGYSMVWRSLCELLLIILCRLA